jgi:hypothetical protein
MMAVMVIMNKYRRRKEIKIRRRRGGGETG